MVPRVVCRYGCIGCGRRKHKPPAKEAPPGPTSAGIRVWPSPTKTPLVAVNEKEAPTLRDVWCVPARAYDWPNDPVSEPRDPTGKSIPIVANVDPREKYPADP